MKLRILWVLTGLWLLVFLYLASESFQHAWASDGSVFDLGTKLETLLAAVGGVTVGCVPVWITFRLARFHKSRERIRLQKERDRIDRKLEAIDRKQANGKAPGEMPLAPASEA